MQNLAIYMTIASIILAIIILRYMAALENERKSNMSLRCRLEVATNLVNSWRLKSGQSINGVNYADMELLIKTAAESSGSVVVKDLILKPISPVDK